MRSHLVVLPVIRIGGVIHPHPEVLGTGKEEVSIIRELSGIASSVVVYDSIGDRFRDHVLPEQPVRILLASFAPETQRPPHDVVCQLLLPLDGVFRSGT